METVAELQQTWLTYLKGGKAMAEEGRIELATVFHGGIPRREIVARLRELREEFGDCFLSADAPVALVIRDVCHVLGLSYEERKEVLTPEVAAAIEGWEHSRLWELSENGKAAIVKETAALPV